MNRLGSAGWTTLHAALCVVAGGVSVVLVTPWLLAAVGAASLLVLVVTQKPVSPRLWGLGVANAITLFRLSLLMVASAVLPTAWAFLVVLVLDGVDGAVARRLGEDSAFGAQLDMETDALFVAVLSVVSIVAGAPLWVLGFGALRYALVLARVVFPAEARRERRTSFGRAAYLVAVVTLLVSLELGPSMLATALLALGLGGLMLSFAGDFAMLRRA